MMQKSLVQIFLSLSPWGQLLLRKRHKCSTFTISSNYILGKNTLSTPQTVTRLALFCILNSLKQPTKLKTQNHAVKLLSKNLNTQRTWKNWNVPSYNDNDCWFHIYETFTKHLGPHCSFHVYTTLKTRTQNKKNENKIKK